MVPYAIDQFLSKGYKLVTVAECLGGQPEYQKVGPRSNKDVSLRIHIIWFFQNLISPYRALGDAEISHEGIRWFRTTTAHAPPFDISASVLLI